MTVVTKDISLLIIGNMLFPQKADHLLDMNVQLAVSFRTREIALLFFGTGNE